MKTKALIFATSFAFTCVFFINLCDLLYSCGCTFLWAGADAHCNIHRLGAKGCPWCAIGLNGSLAVTAAIGAVQAAVSFARWRLRAWTRLALALAAFPLAGAVIALAIGWARGYWTHAAPH